MSKHSNMYVILSMSAFLFTFAICLFFVNNTKTSYAIETGTNDSGFPTSTFSTNNTAKNEKNYIKDAFGTDTTYNNYFKNFNVQNNYFDSSNKNPLYLLMKNLETPKSTETFELISGSVANITDKKITYIINHGYNITNNVNTVFKDGTVTDNNIKQYITQIALWLYIYENKTSYTSTYCAYTGNNYDMCDFLDNSNATVPATTIRTIITNASSKEGYSYLKKITELVDSAKSYQGGTPKIEASNTNSTYTYSKDNTKMYIKDIVPQITSGTENYMYYSVVISDPKSYGVYLEDQDGNKIINTNMMSGSFSVVIPLKKDLSTMNLSTVVIKIYGYFVVDSNRAYTVTKSTDEPLDGLTNNLVVRYGEDKYDRYSKVTLGYSPYEIVELDFKLKNFTKISKIDATNSKELPGAKLVVTNKNNKNEKYEWTSTDRPHYLSLNNGMYTLCETIAPPGYKRQTSCINFNVDSSKVTSVTMKNQPVRIPNTLSTINKVLVCIGIISILLGIGIVSYFINNKKVVNE